MLKFLLQMFLSLPISLKALKTVINDGSNIFLTVLSLVRKYASTLLLFKQSLTLQCLHSVYNILIYIPTLIYQIFYN